MRKFGRLVIPTERERVKFHVEDAGWCECYEVMPDLMLDFYWHEGGIKLREVWFVHGVDVVMW